MLVTGKVTLVGLNVALPGGSVAGVIVTVPLKPFAVDTLIVKLTGELSGNVLIEPTFRV
jgi:hypothetical protein